MDAVLDVTERTDEQLAAEAAREGSDGPAFVALVDRYRQRVWQLCYRLLGNEQDAQDAAQEVFVRLFFQRTRFAGRSKFSTWVHGVTVRVCLSLRRSRGRRQRRETAHAQRSPEHARSESPGLAMDLYQMLETLDEEDRALMIMKYAEGHTFEELAVIFDLSPSACKMRVSRARDKLQQKFGPLEPSQSTQS